MRFRDEKIDKLFPPKKERPKRFIGGGVDSIYRYQDKPTTPFVSIPTQMAAWARYMDLKLELSKDEVMGKKIKFDGKGGVDVLVEGVSIKEARDAIMGNEFAYDADGRESTEPLVKGDSVHGAKNEIMGRTTSKNVNGQEYTVVNGQDILNAEKNIKQRVAEAEASVNQKVETAKNEVNTNVNTKSTSILNAISNLWTNIKNYSWG